MKRESTNQMDELLKGEPPTLQTKGLLMLARNQDKNFETVDKRFENVEEKLDKIIMLIERNKQSTDDQIDSHKEICFDKIKELELQNETVDYFSRHPKVLAFIGILLLIIVAFSMGRSDLISTIIK